MWLDRVSNARALKHNGRLGTLPSAEDVPSLADLVRWSSPEPAERNHGNNVARRYSDGNTPEPSAASPVSPFGAGICLQAPPQNGPFINTSSLWTILVYPRSYPHAQSLDAINDRAGDIYRAGVGLGRRWHLGLGYRLATVLSRYIFTVVS